MTEAVLLHSERTSAVSTARLLSFAIFAVVVLQSSMITRLAINWDEFFFYHEVWQFAQEGNLARGIQTLHVRAFAWITWLPGTAIDHIVTARFVMFGFEVATLASLYALARRFGTREAALFCVLAYVSYGYVFQHGFSFRTDPMAAAFLAISLALLAWKPLKFAWVLAIACLASLALLTTIKSVLWLPAFAGIAWFRWASDKYSIQSAKKLALTAVCVLVTSGLFYWLHSLSLDPSHLAQTGGSGKSAARKMFSLGLQPYWRFIPKAVGIGFVGTALIVAAPFILKNLSGAARIGLAGMWLPVTAFLFYHNTAPYFYAFILPCVFAACVPVAEIVLKKRSVWLVILVTILAVPILTFLPKPVALANQRSLTQSATTMFEKPVSYFDFAFMLPGFDKQNGFMTPWGIESYLTRGRPIYVEALEQKTVPLVIENHVYWTGLLRGDEPNQQFLPADATAIRETYIHAWGLFWLSGLELEAGQSKSWTVRVPGQYRVRQGTLSIAGTVFGQGSQIKLGREEILVKSVGLTPATLMWDEGVSLPEKPMQAGPLWVQF